MASAGPNSPGTLTEDALTGGNAQWSNQSGAGAAGGLSATSDVVVPSDTTYYLVATGFGFAIPAGSTINGILIEVARRSSSASTLIDSGVLPIKGGEMVAELSAGAVWPTTLAYQSYGGASDLLGVAWTATDINSANFGVAVSAVNGSPDTSATAYIDHIRITVYYTEATTTTTTTTAAPTRPPVFNQSRTGLAIRI